MADPLFTQISALIEDQETVDLCRQLVRINSVNPPGNEMEIASFAADYLNRGGLEVELVLHTPQRASVLARLKSSGEIPGLFFSAHLDTVPVGAEKWAHASMDGELADGKIWGLGTSDMKGGLAAVMVAARTLARSGIALRGDLILGLTAGEEVDSLGAVVLAKRQDLRPVQAVVVAEPSSNEIFIAEKGALWLEISARGKSAHGSMPELGHNAIMMIVSLINELQTMPVQYTEHPLLGGFSLSVNTIIGGVKTDVVPDSSTLTVDMRTVPGQKHPAIVRQVEDLIEELSRRSSGFQASVNVTNNWPPVVTSPDEPVVQHFNRALADVTGRPSPLKGVRYYTDAAALVPALQAPMLICGPGEAEMAHQPDEYVEVEKLLEAARVYALAAARLLS